MSKSTTKNHFSPVFANKHWTSEDAGWEYKYYYYCKHRNCVVESYKDKGKTAWGFEQNLYPQELEDRLDYELENASARLYEKLINNIPLTANERMKWGQFIITQAIRTPSFLRYRDYIEGLNNGDYSYKNTILGCAECEENKYIAARNWIILKAHEDDFFIRTDNPVYMTGFLNNPSTTTFYPLTPNLCFVACSAIETIFLPKGMELPPPKQEILQLEKGDTFSINFELLKSTSSSIIVSKKDNSRALSHMSLEILGAFPQIPFMLSSAKNNFAEAEEIEAIIRIMSVVDSIDYPAYREYPFNPFYGVEFSMGINPFSIFGVTDDRLREQGLID